MKRISTQNKLTLIFLHLRWSLAPMFMCGERQRAADFEAEEVCVAASFERMTRMTRKRRVRGGWTYLLVFSSVLNPTLVPTVRYFSVFCSSSFPSQHAAAVVPIPIQFIFPKKFQVFSLSKPAHAATTHDALLKTLYQQQLLEQALQLIQLPLQLLLPLP